MRWEWAGIPCRCGVYGRGEVAVSSWLLLLIRDLVCVSREGSSEQADYDGGVYRYVMYAWMDRWMASAGTRQNRIS